VVWGHSLQQTCCTNAPHHVATQPTRLQHSFTCSDAVRPVAQDICYQNGIDLVDLWNNTGPANTLNSTGPTADPVFRVLTMRLTVQTILREGTDNPA
jgi:hypothetical protein